MDNKSNGQPAFCAESVFESTVARAGKPTLREACHSYADSSGAAHDTRVRCIGSKRKVQKWSSTLDKAPSLRALDSKISSSGHDQSIAKKEDDEFEAAWSQLRQECGLPARSPQEQQSGERCLGSDDAAKQKRSRFVGSCIRNKIPMQRGRTPRASCNDKSRGISASSDVALFERPSFELRRLPSFAIGGKLQSGGSSRRDIADEFRSMDASAASASAQSRQQRCRLTADKCLADAMMQSWGDFLDDSLTSPKLLF